MEPLTPAPQLTPLTFPYQHNAAAGSAGPIYLTQGETFLAATASPVYAARIVSRYQKGGEMAVSIRLGKFSVFTHWIDNAEQLAAVLAKYPAAYA